MQQTKCELQKKNTLNVFHFSRGVLRTTEQSRGDEDADDDDDDDDRGTNVYVSLFFTLHF